METKGEPRRRPALRVSVLLIKEQTQTSRTTLADFALELKEDD
jgi:hypothetical protein